VDRIAEGFQGIQIAEKVGEELTFTNVHAERNVLDVSPALHAQFREPWEKGRRQVIDAKKPKIFKALNGV
jgi:hypothetical protein